MSGRATPPQTVGPFFSIGFAWLERTDLTEGAAAGSHLTIQGCVLDGDGRPVPDAVLEIWQADADGHYAHPEDAADRITASKFFGFGRILVNHEGHFHFATIKPGRVPRAHGAHQAPHLVVSVFMRGLLRRLVTRIYFPGDPANEEDVVLARVPAHRRHTLIAKPAAGEENTLVWNVRLQGDEETVFFEY